MLCQWREEYLRHPVTDNCKKCIGVYMSLFDFLRRKNDICEYETTYEYCPRCDANLILQKGYSSQLNYWICKGCGEMLINPEVKGKVSWVCDECEAMLNVQEGFSEDCGEWTCTECGHANIIDDSEIYETEDEYKASLNNPYKGMRDEDVIEIMGYDEIGNLAGREDVILVEDSEGKLFVKKILETYDASVYRFLKDHPVFHMPRLYGVYEGVKHLVVIEEYIEGRTLAEITDNEMMDVNQAAYVAREICSTLQKLHGMEKPIIHRDIKPSNVMISNENEVFLLDINVAKWYKPEETEDTKLMGTPYFAAPEQLGYGFMASSEKADVFALGMLTNVMITGKLPKEEKASGEIWSIIEKCIELEADKRYSTDQLKCALDEYLEREKDAG